MTRPTRGERIGARGAVVVAFLLVALLVAIDLARPDSLLRQFRSGSGAEENPARRILDDVRQRGPGF